MGDFDLFVFALVAIALGALVSAVHAILTKTDPRAAFGWVAMCSFLPLLGTVFYWTFGVNRIQARAQKMNLAWPQSGTVGERNQKDTLPEQAVAEDVPQEYSELARISDAVTRRVLLKGNDFKCLYNGDEAYPAMLEAVESARHSVRLVTYIFNNDRIGRRFAEALIGAAERGVKVQVLVDWLGEFYSRPRIGKMFQGSKVQFERFLPSAWLRPNLHFNLRNHRKILIVDEKLGFTGGMNIGDYHIVHDAERPQGIRDIHFRIQGPIVGQMLDAFYEDWGFTTQEPVPFAETNTCKPVGKALSRGVSAGPNERFEKLKWILTGAISSARKRVSIVTPYFIPSRELIGSLRSASLRGVKVELVLPETNNIKPVHWASRAMVGELIESGVKVYFQPGPFVHTKIFIVDEHYTQIGSANLDPRSLRLNFEFNLEVYDEGFAKELTEHVEKTIDRSSPLGLHDLANRSFPKRLLDSTARLFSPYL